MYRPTKYEIRNREARDAAVLAALQSKITRPWWGTSTELHALLDVHASLGAQPRPVPRQGFSCSLESLERGELRERGWTVHRWRTASARRIGLVPPGWVWDDEASLWVVHGVPLPPQA
jgi:hypothetical protein